MTNEGSTQIVRIFEKSKEVKQSHSKVIKGKAMGDTDGKEPELKTDLQYLRIRGEGSKFLTSFDLIYQDEFNMHSVFGLM